MFFKFSFMNDREGIFSKPGRTETGEQSSNSFKTARKFEGSFQEMKSFTHVVFHFE